MSARIKKIAAAIVLNVAGLLAYHLEAPAEGTFFMCCSAGCLWSALENES